jgi:hypothetical protein
MPAPLTDPANWIVAAVALAISWLIGRLNNDPWWVVAASAFGGAAFVIGIRWAVSLGAEAGVAAGLATLGMAIAATVHQRRAVTQAHPTAVPTSPRD